MLFDRQKELLGWGGLYLVTWYKQLEKTVRFSLPGTNVETWRFGNREFALCNEFFPEYCQKLISHAYTCREKVMSCDFIGELCCFCDGDVITRVTLWYLSLWGAFSRWGYDINQAELQSVRVSPPAAWAVRSYCCVISVFIIILLRLWISGDVIRFKLALQFKSTQLPLHYSSTSERWWVATIGYTAVWIVNNLAVFELVIVLFNLNRRINSVTILHTE